MDPRELTLLVTAVANGLYGCLSSVELALVAAVFNQLGDTLETLAAQKELLEEGCGGCGSCGADDCTGPRSR